jgi:hypothetical protein
MTPSSGGHSLSHNWVSSSLSYAIVAHTSSGEGSPQVDGAIEPSKPHDEVRKEPWSLPREFQWTTIDIADPNQVSKLIVYEPNINYLFLSQCTEVHNLLSLNYVEDMEASFRFKYSAEFLEWFVYTLIFSASMEIKWHVSGHCGPLDITKNGTWVFAWLLTKSWLPSSQECL